MCALCAELGGAKAVLQDEVEDEEDFSARSGSSWMMGGSQKSLKGTSQRSLRGASQRSLRGASQRSMKAGAAACTGAEEVVMMSRGRGSLGSHASRAWSDVHKNRALAPGAQLPVTPRQPSTGPGSTSEQPLP